SLEGSRRQRAGRALAALAASIVVLAPLVLAVQRATGEWGISGKEGPLIARMYGVAAGSVGALVLRYPSTFARVYAGSLVHQLGYTLAAFHPLLLVPIAVGLLRPAGDARVRRARALVLVTVATFVAAIAINGGRRYAVPLVPLVLPWAAIGLAALGAHRIV